MGGKSIAVGLSRAVRSLQGLSVGDAFGERFFVPDAAERIAARALPAPPWRWTDDTEMALAIVEELGATGEIDPSSLAARFAGHFHPDRGYGRGAAQWALAVRAGQPWDEAARSLFGGQGSFGNGAAMRVGPLGAHFGGDPEQAAAQARLSAQVTHSHPEGQAGAIAVAVAASLVSVRPHPPGKDLLQAILPHLPEGETRRAIELAASLDPADVRGAARRLGAGEKASAADTVPFALYCAAHHLTDFEAALWATVSGLGDRDTTCAIVGGIVAMTCPPPAEWIKAREPLPELRG